MTETTTAPNLDDFGKQAVEQATTLINQRNEKVGVLQAASGDSQGLLEALRNSSDNPDVAKLTQQIEKLDDQRETLWTKRDELLKPQVEEMKANAVASSEAVTAEVDAIDAKVKSARNFLKQMYGEGALKLLPDMLGRKNRSSSDGESGAKRIRGFDIYVDGELATQRDGQGVHRSNFSAAGKKADVDTQALQEAFWAAQGTQVSKDFKERVEFVITDDNKKERTIVAVKTPEHKEAVEAEAATGDANAEVPA